MRIPRSVLLLAVLATLPAASAAARGIPPEIDSSYYPLTCRSVVDGAVAEHGTLSIKTRYPRDKPVPGGYALDGVKGAWTWDGALVHFSTGPLAGGTARYLYGRPTLAGDDVPGRVNRLRVTPAGGGPWLCATSGTTVRGTFPAVESRVAARTGVPVRLPRWIGVLDYAGPFEAKAFDVKPGTYRIGLGAAGCDQCTDPIFGAKRAPASELGHRRRVDLGGGIVGWVGSYGCAFHGTDPDWGPKFCGKLAIVWHQAGVNYSIEARNTTEADLVAAARQAAAT